MAQVTIKKSDNQILVSFPHGIDTFRLGVLQAGAGSTSKGVIIQDTSNSKKILREVPFAQIKQSDGTQFGTSVSATVTALNALINASPDILIKSTDQISALDGVTASDFTSKPGQAVIVGNADLSMSTSSKLNFSAHGGLKLGADLDLHSRKLYTTSTDGDIELDPNGTGDVILGNYTLDGDQTVGSGQDNYVLTYDHASTTISLEEAGGGTTTATPTATFGTSGQQGATLVGTIDNHIPTATYLLKVFNSSGVFQNIYGSVDSSGNISVLAPLTIATGYELRILCADVGELASTVLVKTFAVVAATSFTVWRLQGVDSSGNNTASRHALAEMELYPSQNAGGTHEPNGNATSATSISGVTLSSGYEYGSYSLWKAFDGVINATSSMWWSISNTVANNSWIQVRFANGAKTFQSIKLTVIDNYHVASHFKLLGSNDGTNFVTVIDTTAFVESGGTGGDATTTIHNF